MESIQIPKGDCGFKLEFTVHTYDGDAVDLTGYTVNLKVWEAGTPGTLAFAAAACTVPAATITDGICTYTVTSTDFIVSKTYHAELELTKTGVVESTETFKIVVVDSG